MLKSKICPGCNARKDIMQFPVMRGPSGRISSMCSSCQAQRVQERFWTKVDKQSKHGCWIWTAHMRPDGYGEFSYEGRPILVHRLAWQWLNGTIPRGMSVCHNCPGGDNPACVNVAHLFVGTQQENMQDAVEKGGQFPYHGNRIKGIQHHFTHHSEEEIRAIRLLGHSMSQRAIAALLHLSEGYVSQVIRRKIWRHLP